MKFSEIIESKNNDHKLIYDIIKSSDNIINEHDKIIKKNTKIEY